MTTPASPAQTPGEKDVEEHVRAERDAMRARSLQRVRKIGSALLPLAIVLVIGDIAWGNFVVFASRSKTSEAKGTLKCLAHAAPGGNALEWTGNVAGLELRERAKDTCFSKIVKSRYLYARTPAGATPAVFAAIADPTIRELGTDVWAVVEKGAPLNCFPAVVPRPFFLPVSAPVPDPDPVCAQAFSLLGVNAADLPAR